MRMRPPSRCNNQLFALVTSVKNPSKSTILAISAPDKMNAGGKKTSGRMLLKMRAWIDLVPNSYAQVMAYRRRNCKVATAINTNLLLGVRREDRAVAFPIDRDNLAAAHLASHGLTIIIALRFEFDALNAGPAQALDAKVHVPV